MDTVRFEPVISNICSHYMDNHHRIQSYGTVRGEIGLAYLLSEMYNITQETKYKEWAALVIYHLYFKDIHFKSPSFGYGKAGLIWLIDLLQKEEYVSGGRGIINNSIAILQQECIDMINSNNLDYFTGALGTLYCLYKIGGLTPDIMLLFTGKIIQNYSPDNYARFDYIRHPEDSKRPEGFNLGTPHGITGIALFLLLVKDSNKYDVDDALNILLETYIYIQKEKLDKFSFPSFFKHDNTVHTEGPLAWCYGDLSIAFLFKKSGVLMNCPHYENFGSDLIEHARIRDNGYKDNLSLCHGSISVALMYMKLSELFRDDTIMAQANYWHKISEDYFSELYNLFINKKIYHEFMMNPSLMLGFPGAILYFLFKDGAISMNWDFILLS